MGGTRTEENSSLKGQVHIYNIQETIVWNENGPMIPVKGWSEADGRSPLAADQLVGYQVQGAEDQ